MNKSNIPDVLIWVPYVLISGACLILVSVAGSMGLGFGVIPGVVISVLVAVIIALLAAGIHKKAQEPELRSFFEKKKLVLILVESLVFVALLVGMVFVCSGVSWDVSGSAVYKAAQVTQDGAYFAEVHGGYKIYLYLLNFMLLLLGNRSYAAIILQLILLVVTAISLYFGVRKLAGPAAALLAVAFLGFGPYMITETCNLSPFLLFLFFYGLALNCIGGISYSMLHADRLPEQFVAVLCYLTSGALVGFCCYLDVSGITLLVILTGVICFGDKMRLRNEEEQEFHGDNPSVSRLQDFERSFSEVLGSPVVVFITTILVAAWTFGQIHGSVSSLLKQLALYAPGSFRVPFSVEAEGGFAEGFLIAVLLMFGVYSFWFSKSMGRRGIWLFSAVLLAGMQCFEIVSFQHLNGAALLYLLCVILAGCGLADVCVKKPEKAEAAEEIPMAIIDMDAPQEPVSDKMPMPAINFIENPLPLPKKHTRKVMDYDYEVADDDDFDIQ